MATAEDKIAKWKEKALKGNFRAGSKTLQTQQFEGAQRAAQGPSAAEVEQETARAMLPLGAMSQAAGAETAQALMGAQPGAATAAGMANQQQLLETGAGVRADERDKLEAKMAQQYQQSMANYHQQALSQQQNTRAWISELMGGAGKSAEGAGALIKGIKMAAGGA